MLGRAFRRENVALHLGPAGSAIFPGPGRRDPALFMQRLVPLRGGWRIGQHAAGFLAGLTQVRRQLLVEKAADFIAKGLVFGGEGELHGVIL
jgi:hypothetical protein